MSKSAAAPEGSMGHRFAKAFRTYKYLWLMVLPGLVYYLVFSYLPMYGIQIAFKDYTYSQGIWGSEWSGFGVFREMLFYDDFWIAVRNTVLISLGRLVFEFPVPIVVAILLSELGREKLKRFYQTVFTFPHFISWVVAFGIFFNFLSSDGIVNKLLKSFGLEPVAFFTDPSVFIPVIFLTDLWKTMGWSTIIYLAAIAGLNPEVYEAATVDGAGRFQRIWHIVLPGIIPVIAILLILNVGNSMNAGFDQIFNMYNPNVLDVADIIDTYVYRMSFSSSASFSLSAAAGLFKSVVNLFLLLMADRIVRLFGQSGIWR